LAGAAHEVRGVVATPVAGNADVRAFFDRLAASYAEQHGHAERLLFYRLGLVRAHGHLRAGDAVLDLGCGMGHHLQALAPEIASGVGIDLSPRMIEVARARAAASPGAERLRFEVVDAQELEAGAAAVGITRGSIDLALCIGALEHMLDKRAVLAGVHSLLAPGGRLFCLMPSGDYVWYRRLAPLLGYATKHLSTDVFPTESELRALLRGVGFTRIDVGPWTFIPRGDMPWLLGLLLRSLDVAGRLFGVRSWRGGQWVCAWKATGDKSPAATPA
jgi:SAM-dependent methyltransferase